MDGGFGFAPTHAPKPPKIGDFDSYCLQIFALRVDTFGVDGSEFLIGFGPLHNPTPQIGYPYPFVRGVPQIGPCPPLG